MSIRSNFVPNRMVPCSSHRHTSGQRLHSAHWLSFGTSEAALCQWEKDSSLRWIKFHQNVYIYSMLRLSDFITYTLVFINHFRPDCESCDCNCYPISTVQQLLSKCQSLCTSKFTLWDSFTLKKQAAIYLFSLLFLVGFWNWVWFSSKWRKVMPT